MSDMPFSIVGDDVVSTITNGSNSITTSINPLSPTVSVSLDPSSPVSSSLSLGSVSNTLATFRIGETSNKEDLKVLSVYISRPSSIIEPFKNLSLWQGSTLLANGIPGMGGWTFNLPNTYIVPKSSYLVATLKSDVTADATMPSIVGSKATFSLGAGAVTAIGNTSGLTAVQSGEASSNTFTITSY